MASNRKTLYFTIIVVLTAFILINLYLVSSRYFKSWAYVDVAKRKDHTFQRQIPENYSRSSLTTRHPLYQGNTSQVTAGLGAAILSPSTRKALIENYCKATPLGMLDQDRMRTLLRTIIVVDKYQSLYCVVPKVGSSNWKRVVKMLYGTYHGNETIREVHERDNFVYLSQFSAKERNKRLKSYFKFMFVREPLARLHSAYRSKFVGNNDYFKNRYGNEILMHSRLNFIQKDTKTITFNEFMKYVAETPVRKMSDHWMPMYEVCQPCWVDYDFVGSLENIERDSAAVLRKINATAARNTTLYPQKQSAYHSATADQLQKNLQLIPKSVMEIIISKYSPDFKMFGYKLPS